MSAKKNKRFAGSMPNDPSYDLWQYLDPACTPSYAPAFLGPLVGPGDLCLLTGAPGTAKTHAALSIAVGFVVPSIAGECMGGALIPNLDTFGTASVAIVDGENDTGRWNWMLRRRLDASAIPYSSVAQRLVHALPESLQVSSEGPSEPQYLERLKGFASLDVRLIIIDSLLSVLSPSDISGSDWVMRDLKPLRSAARRLGITLVILTHTARGIAGQSRPQLPYGSMAQEAIADTVVNSELLGHGRAPGIKLTVLKCRHAPWIRRGSSVEVYFKGDCQFDCPDARQDWPCHAEPDATSKPRLTATQSTVLKKLRDSGASGRSSRGLASDLDSSSDAVLEHLGALKQLGLARKDGGGPKTRWYATAKRGADQ